jgi:2-dehydropantoate 2-reductase
MTEAKRRSTQSAASAPGDAPRILVFGAGVLGSLYAARLSEAGYPVTLVARGRRLDEVREHGLVIEEVDTGRETVTRAAIVDAVPEGEPFDVCLVLVRKTQLAIALEALSAGSGVRAFLFMVNTAEGPQPMIEAVGRERVLLGFPNAGGERVGHVVRLMVARRNAITMGELDGVETERLRGIAAAFRAAGFRTTFERDMDAWLRHHVALVAPFAQALYAAGADNVALSRDRATLRLCLRAVREAQDAVLAHGFAVTPRALLALRALPEPALVPLLARLVAQPIMDVGGVRHALAARDEMEALFEELLILAAEGGTPTRALVALWRRAQHRA